MTQEAHHSCNRIAASRRDDGLFDVTAASIRLGCSERYMRRLVQERRIPFVKLGGVKIRFQPRELDRWVASQVVEAKR
jgi:excisionase family DNA binding protein